MNIKKLSYLTLFGTKSLKLSMHLALIAQVHLSPTLNAHQSQWQPSWTVQS